MYKPKNKDNLNESATEIQDKHNGRKHKYNAKSTIVDDIKFDSKLEAKCYNVLKQMERASLIKGFKMQIPYELQPKYKNAIGKKIRAIKYVSDFVVELNNSDILIIDSKGLVLPDFKQKKKMFEYKYNEILHIVKSTSELHNLILGGGRNG
jgi:hypothetical protein